MRQMIELNNKNLRHINKKKKLEFIIVKKN